MYSCVLLFFTFLDDNYVLTHNVIFPALINDSHFYRTGRVHPIARGPLPATRLHSTPIGLHSQCQDSSSQSHCAPDQPGPRHLTHHYLPGLPSTPGRSQQRGESLKSPLRNSPCHQLPPRVLVRIVSRLPNHGNFHYHLLPVII